MRLLDTLLQKYDFFLFDLDGTLIDSAKELTASLNAVMAAQNMRPVPYEIARPFAGLGSRQLLQCGFSFNQRVLSEDLQEKLVLDFLADYEKRILQSASPFEKAEDFLKALKEAGKKILLTTNKPEKFTKIIIHYLKWDSLFDGIFCPENVRAKKPAPDHLLDALQSCDGASEKSVLFGDSETDFNAARAAKIDLYMADFGYADISLFKKKARGFYEGYSEFFT